jgi:oligosaccharide repeat unit polymerase
MYLSVDAQGLIFPACILFSCLAIWQIYSWNRVTGEWFDPYIMFLLSALLFNGGQLLLETFQVNPEGILDNKFPPDLLFKSIMLVVLGMAFFHMGALLSIGFRGEAQTRVLSLQNEAQIEKEARIMGYVMLAVAIGPAFILLKNAIEIVMTSNYLGLYGNDDPTGFQAIPLLLSKFLIPAALFILAGSRTNRTGVILSFAIVITYTAIMFILGSRSSAIMPFIAYLWLFDRLVYRIPRGIIFLFGTLVFAVVFPLVAILRLQSRSAIDLAGSLAALDNPMVAILKEVGFSMLTVVHTVELIPYLRDFELGLGYGYALFTIVPNLFWDLHPSVARGLAADWLTWQIDPTYAQIGGGYGYSFIAEAYLNFGWFGILWLGLMGFALGFFIKKAGYGGHVGQMAMLASFISFFLVFSRGESASIIRPLLWYAVLPYLGMYALRMLLWIPDHRKEGMG